MEQCVLCTEWPLYCSVIRKHMAMVWHEKLNYQRERERDEEKNEMK